MWVAPELVTECGCKEESIVADNFGQATQYDRIHHPSKRTDVRLHLHDAGTDDRLAQHQFPSTKNMQCKFRNQAISKTRMLSAKPAQRNPVCETCSAIPLQKLRYGFLSTKPVLQNPVCETYAANSWSEVSQSLRYDANPCLRNQPVLRIPSCQANATNSDLRCLY